MKPEERLAKHQQLNRAYSDYVGLVLRRALERYGLQSGQGDRLEFGWAGMMFSVMQDGHDWLISNPRGKALRLIPIAWFGKSVEEVEHLNPSRVVCWPGGSDSISSGRGLVISPLDLYVVEKMGRSVDEWMLSQLLEGYGKQLGPLPTAVKQLADGWSNNFESLSSTHVRLIRPLDSEQAVQIRLRLHDSANKQVETEVLNAVEQLTALSRLCGHDTQFSASPNREFYCRCRACEATWSLKTLSNKRTFSMRLRGATNLASADGFNWSGRDWLDFEIAV